ncbi:MAG: crossover junction endodeoxyribonuclease RuvC [Candidatus Levybacteria bacterium]|nr:crossover junction endodeoxyribonuclease RuvC [Candidatus Levybacteria bacterium]
MRILGIDPGIARCGWSIVQSEKFKVKSLNYGCVETKNGLPIELRLKTVYEQITEIIEKEKPDVLAIEELFFNTNAKTAFMVGQARGVVLLTAAQNKIPVAIYTPLQVKVAVTGYGKAEKIQVGKMVKALLKLKEIPKPDDVTDALAIALTHAFSSKFNSIKQPSF